MPLDPRCTGREYPETPEYEVGREHLREFATAIGDPNPAHHDVAAARGLGYPDLIAPPTFAFVLTMRSMARVLFDPEVGLDYGRVVHGEQHFGYARPIHAGDRLVVRARIADVSARGSNEYLTMESQVLTTAGELVVTTREVVVSRGTAEGAA